MRDAITTVLGLEGYPFATAANGLLALEAVAAADHRLILLDLANSVMDGLEFLSAYERQMCPHNPAIILSGEPDLLSQVFPAFVIAVIAKPFEISRLLLAVEKYAARARIDLYSRKEPSCPLHQLYTRSKGTAASCTG